MEEISGSPRLSFQHVLHDPHAMPFLLDFLSQVDKAELLLFWLEVEEYRQLAGKSSELAAAARKMWQKYFCEGVARLEGLAEEEAEALSQQLSHPTLDLFSAAQRRVERCLRERHFPAFRQSSSFRALLEELRNRRPVALAQVLDEPVLLDFFARFLEANMSQDLGNLMFLVDVGRAQAAASGGELAPDGTPRSPPQTPKASAQLSQLSAQQQPSQQQVPASAGEGTRGGGGDAARGSGVLEAGAGAGRGGGGALSAAVSGGQAAGGPATPGTPGAELGGDRRKLMRHNKSASASFSLSAWESSSALAVGSAASQQAQPGSGSASAAATGYSIGTYPSADKRRLAGGARNSPTPQASSRPSSFMDMLPVSAAPPAAANELRAKRMELLTLLEQGYAVLDKYLSRSSQHEATMVSDESRRAVAASLDKVSRELGGGSGKLASVGGFASISTAFAVLDSLAAQLDCVFAPAHKEVMTWMQDRAYPRFRDSEAFAAMVSRIEEETSEAHRERNLLHRVLTGSVASEQLLVLRLPRQSDAGPGAMGAASTNSASGPGGSSNVSAGSLSPALSAQRAHALRSNVSICDDVALQARRRSSFLWPSSSEQSPSPRAASPRAQPAVVQRVLRVGADLVADERSLWADRNALCECECHYDSHEQQCKCKCGRPSLSRRAGGMVFRSVTRLDSPVASLASAQSQGRGPGQEQEPSQSAPRSPRAQPRTPGAAPRPAPPPPPPSPPRPEDDDDADSDSDLEDERADGEEDEAASVADNLLPPEVHSYLMPLGLNVRVIDTEELESESISRLRLNFRTRMSSDPDNASGFLSVPAKPQDPFKRIVVTCVIGETTGRVGMKDITEELDSAGSPRQQWTELEARGREEAERKIRLLAPSGHVHCFAMPCRQHRRPERPSKRRFWYGAAVTTYSLLAIQCPSKTARPGQPPPPPAGVARQPQQPAQNQHANQNLNQQQQQQQTAPDSAVAAAPASLRNLPGDHGYREVSVTLAKHPDFGLGLNLTMNSQGYITLSDFISRTDGSQTPAARSGVLHFDDALISVDGQSVATRRFEDVVKQIKQARAPLVMVFARGWSEAMRNCAYCAKAVCLPTYAFVPETHCAMTRGGPELASLRKAAQVVLAHADDTAAMRASLAELEAALWRRRERVAKLLVAPPHPQTAHPSRWPAMELFRYVRKEHVADVIASLLLERPLVLLSDSASLLVFVAESLKALLWPFVWRHAYQPLLPVPLARAFAERRARRLDAAARRREPLKSSFLVGLCTLELAARDTNLGEFQGFEDIREWMVHEHDNLRPLDRFLGVRPLAPLLQEGTLVLDIDADVLDVPRPSQADLTVLHEAQHEFQQAQQQAQQLMLSHMATGGRSQAEAVTPASRASEAAGGGGSGRFSLRGLDDNGAGRARVGSNGSFSSSSLLLWGGGADAGRAAPLPPRSCVPAFPDALRDRVLLEWESCDRLSAVHHALLKAHASLLGSHREYLLTFEQHEAEQPAAQARAVLALNKRLFLARCPRSLRHFLAAFLKTKAMAAFLVESVYTKSDLFQTAPAAAPGEAKRTLSFDGTEGDATRARRIVRGNSLGAGRNIQPVQARQRTGSEEEGQVRPAAAGSGSPRRRRASSGELELTAALGQDLAALRLAEAARDSDDGSIESL